MAVARQLNTSRQTVNYTMKRYNETKSFKSNKGCGWPKSTTTVTDRAMLKAVKRSLSVRYVKIRLKCRLYLVCQ